MWPPSLLSNLPSAVATPEPHPITGGERRARLRRAVATARRLGFRGRVEYRHVNSSAGGAQYGLGQRPDDDLLIVYADAFQRDQDPEDFSLAAIIAHERGHQFVSRHTQLQRLLAGRLSVATEEILASLVGSIIADSAGDREALVLKALADAMQCGLRPNEATLLMAELRSNLERLL